MGQQPFTPPHTPAWMDPAQSDPPTGLNLQEPPDQQIVRLLGQGFLRQVVGLLGLNDPNQVMAVGAPVDVGPMTGGIIDKLAKRFPLFLDALRTHLTPPTGLGSLAKTVVPGEAPGQYALRPQTIDRLQHFYEIGLAHPVAANWEGSANQELLAAFGGDKDKALEWARLWGATSPNTSAPRNTVESLSALRYGQTSAGMPMTVDVARHLDPKITMAPSKVPNINNAYQGLPLSGDKVEAMAGFMAGLPRKPIDVHILYGVGSDATKLDGEIGALRELMNRLEQLPAKGPARMTDTRVYLRYEQALRDALQSFKPGGDESQIFATTWEGIRAYKGLAPQGGPIDVLRVKGLLEPGAMLDPDRLGEVLRTQGWKPPAILSLLSALPTAPPTPGDPVAR